MKTERVAIAYRLLFAYPLVRPESEQNSSHLQIDCDRVIGNRDSMLRHNVIHDLLSKGKTTEAPSVTIKSRLTYMNLTDARWSRVTGRCSQAEAPIPTEIESRARATGPDRTHLVVPAR
jgi:hypothetical protein